jgi:FkbM family methyltransferase
MIGLLQSKENKQNNAMQNLTLFQKLVQKIPRRMKELLSSSANPFYVYYKGRQALKNNPKNVISFNGGECVTNFIQYCLETPIHFDTCNFFTEKDEALILQHIDNRIKCALGCYAEAMNEEQLEFHQLSQKLHDSVQKRKNFYLLPFNGKIYHLPHKVFDANVWVVHYGLKQLSNSVKEYIADKDFLDIGAFIGDSALMFLQYQPSRIFAYEPVSKTYKDLVKTIKREGSDKIHAIKKGIGDKKISMEIVIRDGSSTLINDSAKNIYPTETIEITTIDTECQDKKVGLIKMDIEGFEYFAIKGGLETIKRDKPVLLISIYHTGKDFFEIPPMIRSYVPEYTFRYLDTYPSQAISEKIIVGFINIFNK